MEKKLIIVSAPPASGKTYVSMKLAENLEHVVYLDKDSLVPLSNVAYKVTGQQLDREGEFFKKNLRDVEYDVILEMACTALKYEDLVLINAPFTSEVRDPSWIDSLRKKLKEEYHARLAVVWVICDPSMVKQRMIDRNSPRDVYKIKNFDTWFASQDFSIPSGLKIDDDPCSLILFNNSGDKEFEKSMKETVDLLEDK